MTIELLHDGPMNAPAHLVLAHGAGAPMTSPFMQSMAERLAARGLRVSRFEFPYMHARSTEGARKAPDPQAVLLRTYRAVVAQLGCVNTLLIGGKSMGGRIASMLADELGVRGLVCLGYPFHPAGKPTQTRVAHLAQLRTPALVVQGTRDALGTRAEVATYTLSTSIEIAWIEGGDHSLVPLKRSGLTEDDALSQAADAIVAFAQRLTSPTARRAHPVR